MVSSGGKSLIISFRTVSPPIPESNTPMALFMFMNSKPSSFIIEPDDRYCCENPGRVYHYIQRPPFSVGRERLMELVQCCLANGKSASSNSPFPAPTTQPRVVCTAPEPT